MCNSAPNAAPRGVRLHIVLCGRRNAGKSSLLNYLSNQQSAIVSETKGTTTDAVRKPFELHPVGPATLIDTAGLDDTGALGLQRIAASRRALQQADIAVYVLDEQGLDEFDRDWLLLLQSWQLPILVVANKQDLAPLPAEHQRWLKAKASSSYACRPKKQNTGKTWSSSWFNWCRQIFVATPCWPPTVTAPESNCCWSPR